jgi:ribosome-associated toxin RatA of RatAB toxin-antitoxin module
MTPMKPVRLQATYIICAPRKAVYDLITDFESAPKHFPSVAKALRIIKRDGNHLEAEAETKAFLGSKTFKVHMDVLLRPEEGFTSTNTSFQAVENEVMTLEEIPEGTRVVYDNEVEIKSRFFRILGGFLIKKVALKYWEHAVILRMKRILEHQGRTL